ncbi:MAG: radical SAM protein, partial [Nanoarchaeota archaeon]|nr:radical SAM protein [Nanoarchaeota archaeon]
VKQARGDLKSYKPKDIIKEVKKAVKESCKNIHLTAQDTGCWGMDTKEKLSNLLNEVCKLLGDFEVRLGMANPNHIIKNLEELIKAYKNPKMKKFLHIPVQSGSNKVLKDMKRKYTVQQFNKIVKKFRKEIPEIHIATDVILGFPTETKSDFKKTFNLIKEIKPEVLNISRYGIRQGTEAAKMKQLPVQEISKRSIAIHKLWKSLW